MDDGTRQERDEAASVEAVKWDSFFDNPRDDIVLVSSDGVHFRADSYRLSNVSPVFKGMVESSSQATSIELDCTSAALSKFLGIVHSPPPIEISLRVVGSSVFAGVHHLAKFFDFTTLVTHMDTEIKSTWRSFPKVVFAYAGFTNDVKLGQQAMRKMAANSYARDADLEQDLNDFHDVMKGLRPAWKAALWQAASVYRPSTDKRGGRMEIVVDWDVMCHKFDPDEDTMPATFTV